MSWLHISARSDRGHVREKNEDAVLINGVVEREAVDVSLPSDGFQFVQHGVICAVSDGMGGHAGGDVASHLVLRSLAAESFTLSGCSEYEQAETFLRAAIERVHRIVVERGEADSGLVGMGATLTGLYLRPEYGIFFHAGDSRLYHLRGDFLMQLSTDHVPEDGDGPRAARSGVITSSIGGGSEISPDVQIGEVCVQPGEMLLICSDGLTDMVEVGRVEEILAEGRDDLWAAADELVAEAKEAGGNDNISVIVVRMDE